MTAQTEIVDGLQQQQALDGLICERAAEASLNKDEQEDEDCSRQALWEGNSLRTTKVTNQERSAIAFSASPLGRQLPQDNRSHQSRKICYCRIPPCQPM
eukprot:scaffold32434_cov39-Cyclotella_meneghiniana.AAC.2